MKKLSELIVLLYFCKQEIGNQKSEIGNQKQMGTKTFKDLIMWQKAHAFVLLVYKISEKFPKTEQFCLTSQLRRAAISIPANIAEGYRRKGKADKLRFYNIAQTSLEECRYYVVLSKDLNYINISEETELNLDLEDTSRGLTAYCNKMEAE